MYSSEWFAAVEEKFDTGAPLGPVDVGALLMIMACIFGCFALGICGVILWVKLDASCIQIFEAQFMWLFLVFKANTVFLFVMVLFWYS